MVSFEPTAIQRVLPSWKNLKDSYEIFKLSRAEVRSPKRPLVSIVIATFNWSNVLKFAIQSVLDQSYENFELIIVGDGCTDDTAEVVANFKDKRITFFNLEVNSGSQSIPNRFGVRLARGEFVAYLGQDDIWLPNHLEWAISSLLETSADLSFSGMVAKGPKGSNLIRIGNVGIDPFQTNLWMAPSAAVHRKDAISLVGTWVDFRDIYEPPDVEFFSRFYQHRKEIILIKAITVLKFPSAWNPGSYKSRGCDLQSKHLARIARKPNFIGLELFNFWMIRFHASPEFDPLTNLWLNSDRSQPGWNVHLLRKIRGLEDLRNVRREID